MWRGGIVTYAVCTARCLYCGRFWRPCIEHGDDGSFPRDHLECPRCGGMMGRVEHHVGDEPTEEAARARAEALAEETH